MKALKLTLVIAAVLFVVVVLGVGAYFLGGALGLYSVVLGEEGVTPYDLALAGNTFSPAKFVEEGGSCDNLGGVRAEKCPAALKTPYSGISVRDGKLYQSALPYATPEGQRRLRTEDLRLVNFWVEFQMKPEGVNGGTVCWYDYCYTDTRSSKQRSYSPVAALELRWDDYKEGHYQLFINNELREEGVVPEGTPFYLTKTPKSEYGTEWWLAETMVWSNPRVKRVFGCDLQAGEVLAFKNIPGPEVFTINDLQGFKRFCVDHPSTFLKSGVASTSKDVYYSLAQGEPVKVGANQAWKVVYVADAVKAGVRLDCGVPGGPVAGVDVDRKACGELTGFADLGPDVVYVADTIDYDADVAFTARSEVLFNTNFKQRTVLGGVFNASPIMYTCQGSDGFDVSDDYFFNYPAPREECYTFTLNGRSWTGGTADVVLDDFFTVNVESAHANLCYCDGKNGALRRADTWNVQYRVQLTKPLLQDVELSFPEDVLLGSEGTGTVTFENDFGRSFQGKLIVQTRSSVTGEIRSYTKELEVAAGTNELSFPLQTGNLGDQVVTARVYLATDADSLLVSEEGRESYVVTQGTAPGTEPEPNTNDSAATGFLDRIARFFQDLFSRIFGGAS